ncbi:hypothetical protein ASF04_11325 [Duganella sp. Leaf61]|uniref:hypothetical protein n=1 Tax=Duganella sp. Leaf61 TaxID=1736227 RepID=UPI0006FCCB9E|nr:hypothetical protein [Duganella sp. Leaf61]KQN70444.1 hypothetical protein ASF04_11325 [Duganella sp. Leaf61]
MRHACLTALLAAALVSPACLVHAAPFYEGKSLVHPVIIASQDSGADIAFIKEAGGVTGYYCVCLGPDNKPAPNTKTLKLDTFGKAEIRSVFYAALDRDNAPEHQTMLVLLRLDGKPGLRAYRYNDNSDICYHPNGKVASSFTFRNGKATDCGKKFDDTGKQTSPGPEGCPPPKKPHFIFGE